MDECEICGGRDHVRQVGWGEAKDALEICVVCRENHMGEWSEIKPEVLYKPSMEISDRW